MTSNIIFWAMFSHVSLIVLLYVALTILRAPSAWGVDTRSGFIGRIAVYEQKVSANLINQFEWPLVFYACCILVVGAGISDWYMNLLAILFVIGRVLHSFVHVFTGNIRLRGAVFTINFLAVYLMWLRLCFIYP